MAFAPGPNWITLDDRAPVRSVGWHELKAVIKSTTIDFYVDGVLAKANVAYANSGPVQLRPGPPGLRPDLGQRGLL